MTTLTTTKNPFISTFRSVRCNDELGFTMTSVNGGASYTYMNAFGRVLELQEVQLFDDFGSVEYDLRYID